MTDDTAPNDNDNNAKSDAKGNPRRTNKNNRRRQPVKDDSKQQGTATDKSTTVTSSQAAGAPNASDGHQETKVAPGGNKQNRKNPRRRNNQRNNGKVAPKEQGGSATPKIDPSVATGKVDQATTAQVDPLDSASTLVRPSLRVHVASSAAKKYPRSLKHDDVVLVPELFGAEEDWDIYNKIADEIAELQKEGVEGSEWVSWKEDSHQVVIDPSGSKTVQEIVDRLCKYFEIEKSSVQTRLNMYKDANSWEPLHHDSAAFNATRAKTQNISVWANFGASREMAFSRATIGGTAIKDDLLLYFPQPNNGCISFGRDVNIRFTHGINALPEEESENNSTGRISLLLWGLASNVIEEAGSPAMLASGYGKVQKKSGRQNKRKANKTEKNIQEKSGPESIAENGKMDTQNEVGAAKLEVSAGDPVDITGSDATNQTQAATEEEVKVGGTLDGSQVQVKAAASTEEEVVGDEPNVTQADGEDMAKVDSLQGIQVVADKVPGGNQSEHAMTDQDGSAVNHTGGSEGDTKDIPKVENDITIEVVPQEISQVVSEDDTTADKQSAVAEDAPEPIQAGE